MIAPTLCTLVLCTVVGVIFLDPFIPVWLWESEPLHTSWVFLIQASRLRRGYWLGVILTIDPGSLRTTYKAPSGPIFWSRMRPYPFRMIS